MIRSTVTSMILSILNLVCFSQTNSTLPELDGTWEVEKIVLDSGRVLDEGATVIIGGLSWQYLSASGPCSMKNRTETKFILDCDDPGKGQNMKILKLTEDQLTVKSCEPITSTCNRIHYRRVERDYF